MNTLVRRMLGAATIGSILGLTYVSTKSLHDNTSRELITRKSEEASASALLPVPSMPRTDGTPNPLQSYSGRLTSYSTTTSESYQELLPETPSGLRDWRYYNPESLVLRAADGAEHVFVRIKAYEKDDRLIWVGRNDREGEFFVSTGAIDHWTGLLSQPGEDTQEFTVRDGQLSIRVIAPEDETCGLIKADQFVPVASTSATTTTLTAGATYTVDVAFFYDAATLTFSNGSVDQLRTSLLTRVEACNQALAQSLVSNFQWNLAGLFPIGDYTVTGKMSDDLSTFSNTTSTVGKDVVTQSASIGADQHVLLVSGTRDYAGLGEVNGRYSVVKYDNTTYLTMAHEMAHNFGAWHDRVTEKATDGDGKFFYGYTIDVTEMIGGNPWVYRYGTVMSYFGNRIAYYSNPDVTYKGLALGKPVNDPQAAYVAKTMTDAAPNMAAYRTAPTQPSITRQPANTSATVGNSFTFSVSADGGGTLVYQWYFNDSAISGATSSTYSKTAATSDQGNYSVKVTNLIGSVTSNSASLTVTAAPAPSSNSGSSGGGGGGAPSLFFLGALAVAAVFNRTRNRFTQTRPRPHFCPLK